MTHLMRDDRGGFSCVDSRGGESAVVISINASAANVIATEERRFEVLVTG